MVVAEIRTFTNKYSTKEVNLDSNNFIKDNSIGWAGFIFKHNIWNTINNKVNVFENILFPSSGQKLNNKKYIFFYAWGGARIYEIQVFSRLFNDVQVFFKVMMN